MKTNSLTGTLSLPERPVGFWAVALGFSALAIPTVIKLATSVWTDDDNAHGPLILLVIGWIVWQKRSAFLPSSNDAPAISGWLPLLFGLLVYLIGRSQGVIILEVASHIAILLGLLLLFKGWGSVKALWFPLLYMIFLLPLPGFFVDAATAPLKSQVSISAEEILYLFGYPIARNGVVLSIGQYQLLVADACSGLHSMYSLSALGFLYLYMVGHASKLQNFIILASILPIAFAANIVRVIALVLVTFYFGDAVAQGFIHKFAGMILFAVALLLLVGLDGLLAKLFPKRVAA